MKVARVTWVLAFVASVGILVGSLPGYWARVNQVRASTEFYPVPQGAPWLGAPLSLGTTVLCLVLAVLLFLRKPNHGMALFLSFFLFLYGIIFAGPLETFLPYWFPAFGALALQVQGAVLVVLLALILVFPNGHFMPRWTRWLVVIAILEVPIAFLAVGDLSELYRVNSLASQVLYGILGILLILAQGVQLYRYRNVYTPLERQQTKWVLYGFVVSYILLGLVSIPYFYLQSLPPDAPPPWWVSLGSVGWQFSLSILPLTFTIAILHARLWDIDVIIRRTLTYALVTALLAVVFFSSVILLQQIFASIVGTGQNELVTVLSTLVIAALFVPVRNRIQTEIDKRFNRNKYDAQQVLNDFAQTMRDETDLEKLTGRLMQVVDKTMQPKSVSVWLKVSKEPRQRIDE